MSEPGAYQILPFTMLHQSLIKYYPLPCCTTLLCCQHPNKCLHYSATISSTCSFLLLTAERAIFLLKAVRADFKVSTLGDLMGSVCTCLQVRELISPTVVMFLALTSCTRPGELHTNTCTHIIMLAHTDIHIPTHASHTHHHMSTHTELGSLSP